MPGGMPTYFRLETWASSASAFFAKQSGELRSVEAHFLLPMAVAARKLARRAVRANRQSNDGYVRLDGETEGRLAVALG